MAQNKNAQLRYKALDQCFSNFYKKFYIDDLIEFCSKVLSEHYAKSMSVSRRQIFDDIDFMKSEAGFEAPIVSYKEGRKVYYRYSEKDFSILKKPLNPTELITLNEALETLNRMNSLPGFDWLSQKGFGFVDDVFIPSSIIEKNKFIDFQSLKVVAVRKYDKQKAQLSWNYLKHK